MTMTDVVMRTAMTLGTVIVMAVVGWYVPALAIPGAIIGLVLGLVNAFKHSQDAWSSVGAFGLTLSILSALLALAAFAFFTPARRLATVAALAFVILGGISNVTELRGNIAEANSIMQKPLNPVLHGNKH